MAKKLYVGNMPYSTTSEQLRELFAQAGEVAEITIITDRDTGRPKGFGFVEMATEEGSQEIRRDDFIDHDLPGGCGYTRAEALPGQHGENQNNAERQAHFR